MTCPMFKVGDEVEFELSSANKDTPRWNWTDDKGGSGKWAVSKVLKVTKDVIAVVRGGSGYWLWPSVDDPSYHPDQWKREGWLRHKVVLKQEQLTLALKRNDFSLTRAKWLGKVNDKGCECGVWASGGVHSSWCKCR
jgi:hypothetical protein